MAFSIRFISSPVLTILISLITWLAGTASTFELEVVKSLMRGSSYFNPDSSIPILPSNPFSLIKSESIFSGASCLVYSPFSTAFTSLSSDASTGWSMN